MRMRFYAHFCFILNKLFKEVNVENLRVVRFLMPEKIKIFIPLFILIHIGNNCFIGCKSIIMPNVTIGNNSAVGTGSAVTKRIPSGEI
ncbi:MAG: hypothetical protein J6V53_05180 [Alphaproteobacteria bacterium]|nr:hypothetical protein [Alphaproteobacteria bacterium]